jgi:hypothetical protein
MHLNIINKLLNDIKVANSNNTNPYEKPINLVVNTYNLLVDSYYQLNAHSNWSILVTWLFVNLIAYYLKTIDKLLAKNIWTDYRHEFGFKRNPAIQINDTDFWKMSYEFLFSNKNYIQALPPFMRLIVTDAFKLCRYFDIIKLFTDKAFELNQDGTNIHERFIKSFGNKLFTFPLLANEDDHRALALRNGQVENFENLLDLNFYFVKRFATDHNANNSIDSLTKFVQNTINQDFIGIGDMLNSNRLFPTDFNIIFEIDSNLSCCLNPVLKTYSNLLMRSLTEKFHLFIHFELLHSFYLFKSNEVMFLFSKSLADLVKSNDVFEDDLILNKLFYRSIEAQSSYTTIDKNFNIHKLFQVKYDKECARNMFMPTKSLESVNRLINGVSLKFSLKWPINFIIQIDDLNVYNRLFNAILQIKQVKYNLDGLEFKGDSPY